MYSPNSHDLIKKIGGIPPIAIVISFWYLNGSLPIKQPFGVY